MDINQLVSFDPNKPGPKDLTVERIAAKFQMEAPVNSREDVEVRLEGISVMLKHVSSLLNKLVKEPNNGTGSGLDRG